MKTDIEIAHEKELLPITLVAKKIGLSSDDLELYGNYKAKINHEIKASKKGKLILVTSINPTPLGEGKTTMSIGLSDALCSLGKKSVVVLREPSLGPVFGIKGGATGGGYAQVVPMEDINLHFTGDMHAITSANNLIAAAIDHHLFLGNKLDIDPNRVTFPRCMDMNDRSLRKIKVSVGSDIERSDQFVITVASEIMAILCLALNLNDLKKRIGNIIVAYSRKGMPVYVKDLGCVGAVTLLLKDAIKPNLVQTLEGNPAIIHGGPFANIAHGCNSIIATKLALNLADFVVTEAGFGADLGAEKFLDIKCPSASIMPDAIVINATLKSLKYNANVEVSEVTKPNLKALKEGIINLKTHIENMQKYSNHIIVCLNKFSSDTKEELDFVKEYCENMNVKCEVSLAHEKGGQGSVELAKKVLELLETKSSFKPLYDASEPLKDKIEKIIFEIYRASAINYNNDVLTKMQEIEKYHLDKLPICIAKTQYSLSDDPKKLGLPTNYTFNISDIKVCNGAGFIVVYAGNIMTMPGLGKNANYFNMDIKDDGTIIGLF